MTMIVERERLPSLEERKQDIRIRSLMEEEMWNLKEEKRSIIHAKERRIDIDIATG